MPTTDRAARSGNRQVQTDNRQAVIRQATGPHRQPIPKEPTVTITQDVAAKRPANTEPVPVRRKRHEQAAPNRHPLINNGQSGLVVLITLLCVCILAGFLGVAAAALTG
jgi:hypothetical protein